MELRGKQVVVVGLGASGQSACRFCAARGARVAGLDDKARDKLPADLVNGLEAAGVELGLAEAPGRQAERLRGADLMVISPGVPSSPAIEAAEKAGVRAVAEVELAAWYLEAPVVGITGTNGKSTVTALIGDMLARSGRPTFVGGNFGTPLIDAVGTEAAGPGGALVVELSSFQLERVERLRPRVAVLLNVTEDHLDRYPTMASYAAAKARIFAPQTADDAAVVNGDDALSLALARAGRARVHRFGRSAGEVHEADGHIVDEATGERYPLSLLKIAGAHNRSNACAAVLAARLAGATPAAIAEALGSFTGLAHRMVRVAEKNGVVFYNDSKATNVGAAVAALEGLDRTAVLIAGGRDKGGDYGPLREQVERKVRAVVLIGEAAFIIERAFMGTPAQLVHAGDMKDAVRRAAALARPGDAVLLAPACSSYDMFPNYKERGLAFARAVEEL